MSNINFENFLSQVKQKIENLNLKDKWGKFKLKLDQLPIPKWLLVIITSISVVVTIASFVSKSPENEQFDCEKTEQYDPADEYDVMVEEEDSSQKDSNATQPQPKNEIWYTSKDGTIVEPYESRAFGANIVSNSYQDGKGVIVFDDDVRYIGPVAFYQNCNLTSISIPEGVTKITSSSFSSCTSLSSVTIPRGVTEIGERAFSFCTSLTSIIIPNSVIHIGEAAFANCTSLTSIAIPYPSSHSTTSLGEQAFANCEGLTSIYCKSSNPPELYRTNVFDGVSSDCKLYVQPQSVEKYKQTEGWRKFYFNTVGYDFPQDYYDKATNRVRGYND